MYLHHGSNPDLAIHLVHADDRGGRPGVNPIRQLAVVHNEEEKPNWHKDGIQILQPFHPKSTLFLSVICVSVLPLKQRVYRNCQDNTPEFFLIPQYAPLSLSISFSLFVSVSLVSILIALECKDYASHVPK